MIPRHILTDTTDYCTEGDDTFDDTQALNPIVTGYTAEGLPFLVAVNGAISEEAINAAEEHALLLMDEYIQALKINKFRKSALLKQLTQKLCDYHSKNHIAISLAMTYKKEEDHGMFYAGVSTTQDMTLVLQRSSQDGGVLINETNSGRVYVGDQLVGYCASVDLKSNSVGNQICLKTTNGTVIKSIPVPDQMFQDSFKTWIYENAVREFNNCLKTMDQDNLLAKAKEIYQQVIAIKKAYPDQIPTLSKVLTATTEVLTYPTPENIAQYKAIARRVENAKSGGFKMKLLGGLMVALGVCLMAVACLAMVGTLGMDAGISQGLLSAGAGLTTAGVGFFASGCRRSPLQESLREVSAEMSNLADQVKPMEQTTEGQQEGVPMTKTLCRMPSYVG